MSKIRFISDFKILDFMRNKIPAPLNVNQTMSSFELFSSAIFFITDKVLCKMTLLQVCIFPKVGKGFPEQGRILGLIFLTLSVKEH